jgi:hypothetical protein
MISLIVKVREINNSKVMKIEGGLLERWKGKEEGDRKE